jgi:hypothetical protein
VTALPYGLLTSRQELAEKLNIPYHNAVFARLPKELHYRLPDRRAVFGNKKTIAALKKEFAK